MSCPQPLLIHADGTGSCSLPGCLGQGTLMEAVRRHRYVVNCRTVLGTRCAVCHGAGGDDADVTASSATKGADTPAMCPGIAVVHADLSLECSEPDCATTPARDGWLAEHSDVRSCTDLHGGCPRCPVASESR
jgi:hypothetical protein